MVVDGYLGLVIVIVPALMGATFELAELYKQAVLVGLMALALTAFSAKCVFEKHFEKRAGWSQLVLGGFLFVTFLSACFSVDRYTSFLGQFTQRAWSFASLAALVVFAWLLMERVRQGLRIRGIIFLSLVSGLALAGVSASLILAKQGWNPAGSVYALSISLATTFVISFGFLVRRVKSPFSFIIGGFSMDFLRILSVLVALVTGGMLVSINFWLGWLGVAFGMTVLSGLEVGKAFHRKNDRYSFIPSLALAVLSVCFLIRPLPWHASAPAELALSQRASWETTQQTLAQKPLFGSGPGTWIYDHALYRSSVLNSSPFWSARFDRSISTLLTLFATTGMVGTAVFLVLVFLVAGMFIRQWLRIRKEHELDSQHLNAEVLFAAWSTIALSMGFYNFNLSHQILFWMLSGCLLGASRQRELIIGSATRVWKQFLVFKTFVLAVGTLLIVVFFGQVVWAEARLSTIIQNYKDGQASFEQVRDGVGAIRRIHPWHDVSARVLSQAYLVQLAAQMKDARVSTSSTSAITDQAMRAVDLALEATRLNPASAENWMNAGFVYARLAGFTRGAAMFALKKYEEAWKRDPQSPVYPTEMANVKLLQVQELEALLEAKDAATQQQAAQERAKALDEARRYLETALALKGDYVPARYYFAVVLERQGKFDEALHLLEQVVLQEPTPARLFDLALLYVRLEKIPAAVSALEQVIALDGSQVSARFELARLYERTNRISEALVQMKLVSEALPGNEAVLQRIRFLEQQVSR